MPPSRLSSPASYAIHRSAWKINSSKFTVANGSSTYRQAPAYGLCYPPSWSKRSDLAPFVAPLCIKGLRLVTVRLPEKSCTVGQGEAMFPELRLDGILRSSGVGDLGRK